MNKDFTIKEMKSSDFQDNHGNTWCDMVLVENPGVPVKLVVKDPSKFKAGDKLYGHVEKKQNKAGNVYFKFKREQREEGSGSPQPNQPQTKQTDEYWETKNKQIRAQWAIGQAMTKFPEGCYETSGDNRATLLGNIKDFALELFNMVEDVSNGTQEETSDEEPVVVTEEDMEQVVDEDFMADIPF